MADGSEVKEFVETIVVEPSEDNELIESSEKDTQSSSSEDENQEVTSETVQKQPKEQLLGRTLTKEGQDAGETSRERALRLEIERLRGHKRQERVNEVFKQGESRQEQPVTTQNTDVLSKYDPEEITRFKEVFDSVAEERGYVKKDQLRQTTYQQQAQNELDTFLSDHGEYSPENDKDDLMWQRFIAEFNSGIYNKNPDNPKDLKKTFTKIHEDIFGTKPSMSMGAINAQKEKVRVASHAGTSTQHTPSRQSTYVPEGLRIDMLKGLTDKELEDMGLK